MDVKPRLKTSDVSGIAEEWCAETVGRRRTSTLLSRQAEVGFQQTELGLIPNDWHVASLGSVSRIKTGSRNNDDKVEDGEYPLFVRSLRVERINTYSYDCEAILVPGEGNIGNIFHYIRGRFDVLKLARFRGQNEIGDQAALSMYRRSNSTGEMNPIDVCRRRGL
jgi:hypothetical protein